ncbi:MAG: hypothetical protein OCC45_07770 [Desulfotalea sp.]
MPAQNTKCIACNEEKLAEEEFCSNCLQIMKHIEKDPHLVNRLSELAKSQQTSEESESLDVLDAIRYRVCDRDKNTWYVSVSENEGNPVEVFASTAFEKDRHLQSKIANLTTITRLLSLILRYIFLGERLTLEKTIIQLDRSSRQTNDLPEMLSKILSNYIDRKKK